MVLVGFGAQLSAIDLKEHRLPNQLVAWFTAIQLATLIALSLDDFNELKTPLLVAIVTTAIYLILFILSRGALGMGDVKFAFPLGLCVGWYSANHWLVAIFVSFLLAGLVAVIGLATKRMTRKSRLAFGPYMFLGSSMVCGFVIFSQ